MASIEEMLAKFLPVKSSLVMAITAKHFYLIPLAACLSLASYKTYHTIFHDLASPKLGGFGMFAITDNRSIFIEAQTSGGKIPLSFELSDTPELDDPFSSDKMDSFKSHPTRERLEKLKDLILESRFIQHQHSLQYIPRTFGIFKETGPRVDVVDQEAPQHIGKNIIKKLEVSVWKKVYDKSSHKISYALVQRFSFDN